jgi:hypothetical protein
MQNLLKLILSVRKHRQDAILPFRSLSLSYLSVAGRICPCLCKRPQQRAGFVADIHSMIRGINGDLSILGTAKYTFYTYGKESQLIESSAFLASPSLSRLVPASEGLSRCQPTVPIRSAQSTYRVYT